MELKRLITRKVNIQQLNAISRYGVIHTKELQADGTYLVNYTQYLMASYEKVVNKLVKEKYSDSEEFAILRKAISNPNNDEYLIYNAYVEDCKVRAKAFIEERKSLLGK